MSKLKTQFDGVTDVNSEDEYFVSECAKAKNITPLMMHVLQGNQDKVRELIENKVDIDQHNSEKWTALHIACRNSKLCSEQIVKMLLEAKANLNLQNNKGLTSLTLASGNSNQDSTENTVRMLIDAKADLEITKDNGFTALMDAAYTSGSTSSDKTVKMLLEAKASVTHTSNLGYTTLMTSVCSVKPSSEKTIEMLVNAKADIDYMCSLQFTALMSAVRHSPSQIVKQLIDLKASVNRQTHNGFTSLYYAIECIDTSSDETLKILLESKASLDLKYDRRLFGAVAKRVIDPDETPKTALMIASETQSSSKSFEIISSVMKHRLESQLRFSVPFPVHGGHHLIHRDIVSSLDLFHQPCDDNTTLENRNRTGFRGHHPFPESFTLRQV